MHLEDAANDNAGNCISKITMAKLCLATHPQTTSQCLKRLANHKCNLIAIRVAGHPNTSADVLDNLSTHSDPEVRIAVGENIMTPQQLLMKLAVDENADVRYSLAENHNLPLTVLSLLLEDENPYVVARANHTLERLRNSKYHAVAWMPYFRHQQAKQGNA